MIQDVYVCKLYFKLNIRTIYLTYVLAFYLAVYLTYILTWYLAYILIFHSWKLLIASHCHRCLCHPISSHVVSSQRFLPHLTSPHLISSRLMISLLFSGLLSWSQLFNSLLIASWFFSCFLSSSELFSFQLLSASPFYAACLYSALHSSSHARPSQLILSHLISAYPAHLSSSHIFSSQLLIQLADLISSQPFWAHSQIISALLWPRTCPKATSRRQSHKKYDLDAFLTINLEEKWKRQKLKKHQKVTSQLWHNLSNAVCKLQVAKDQRTTCATQRGAILMQPPQWFGSSGLQKTKEN